MDDVIVPFKKNVKIDATEDSISGIFETTMEFIYEAYDIDEDNQMGVKTVDIIALHEAIGGIIYSINDKSHPMHQLAESIFTENPIDGEQPELANDNNDTN